MKKYMNLFFFEVLIVGAMGGYLCSHLSGKGFLAGSVGFMVSLFSIFVGMILAFMKSKVVLKESLSKQESEFQQMIHCIVSKEREVCLKTSLDVAKNMSNRVANRVVSKYVEGLSDDARRKAVLASVDMIIEDEIKEMTEDGCGSENS